MKRFVVVIGVLMTVVGLAAAGTLFGLGYYLSPQDRLAKSHAVVAISGGETAARTDEAVRLYRDGWASNIIFSGAALDPNSPSNARAMARDARAQGVPSTAIQLDESAMNTRQNAAGVAEIVKQEQYGSIILVTSPYHQRRAYVTFRRLLPADAVIINHSSYDQQWRRSEWWSTPFSRNVTMSELQKVIFELVSEPKAK